MPYIKISMFVGYDDVIKRFRIWIFSDHKLEIIRNIKFNKSSALHKIALLNHIFTPILSSPKALLLQNPPKSS